MSVMIRRKLIGEWLNTVLRDLAVRVCLRPSKLGGYTGAFVKVHVHIVTHVL